MPCLREESKRRWRERYAADPERHRERMRTHYFEGGWKPKRLRALEQARERVQDQLDQLDVKGVTE